jgi:NADH-quinone oxidoreductase subunit E
LRITTVRLAGPAPGQILQKIHATSARILVATKPESTPETLMAFALNAEQERQLEDILSRYPNKMAACIPALHLCQEANENWVSEDVIAFVAKRLELSTAHVKGVVTFYTLFNQKKPGKHQVWVCHTLSCALRGAEDLVKHCEKRLGVHVGETTKDGKITLRTAECLAACGTAPVMQVDKRYHENLTTQEVDRILDRLLAG